MLPAAASPFVWLNSNGSMHRENITSSFGLCIVLGLLAISCTQVRNIPLPDAPHLLVVNAPFSPDSSWKVTVNRTGNSVTDSNFFLPYIDDARVELWEGEAYLGTMEAKGQGVYRLPDTPRIGLPYRLKAWAPGYDTVYAHSYIPRYPTEISAEWDLSQRITQTDQFGGTYGSFRLGISLQDPPGESNYYLFTTAHYDSCICEVPRIFQEDTIIVDYLKDKLKTKGLYSNISDAAYSDEVRLLLPDATFDGQVRYLDVFTPDTNEYFNVANFTSEQTGGKPSGFFTRLYIQLYADTWSLSDDMYQYLLTYFQQGMQTANPFATYSNVYSNVEGGLGIFAGYQRRLILIYSD